MHFHKKKTHRKNLLKRHHSHQNHQFKGCTDENVNSCIPCFTILILTLSQTSPGFYESAEQVF